MRQNRSNPPQIVDWQCVGEGKMALQGEGDHELLARLRDLKLSLLGTLSMLSALRRII
jgi:hypothetical protein